MLAAYGLIFLFSMSMLYSFAQLWHDLFNQTAIGEYSSCF